MAKSGKIRVMISSRCKARISYQDKSVLLSDLRERIREAIERSFCGQGQQALFDCWINERSSGSGFNETWWEPRPRVLGW